jgi:hypothetical protein
MQADDGALESEQQSELREKRDKLIDEYKSNVEMYEKTMKDINDRGVRRSLGITSEDAPRSERALIVSLAPAWEDAAEAQYEMDGKKVPENLEPGVTEKLEKAYKINGKQMKLTAGGNELHPKLPNYTWATVEALSGVPFPREGLARELGVGVRSSDLSPIIPTTWRAAASTLVNDVRSAINLRQNRTSKSTPTSGGNRKRRTRKPKKQNNKSKKNHKKHNKKRRVTRSKRRRAH